MTTKTMKTAKCIIGALLLEAVLFSFSVFGESASLPDRPAGYVTDLADVIDPEAANAINRFALELERKTASQVAVVTLKTTRPETIQGYSVRLFDKWKIGQKGKDNGVLILVAVDDRMAWITTGYGIEGIIPDVVANKIVRDLMVPSFRKGDYSEGVLNSAVAVISLIAKEHDVAITGKEDSVHKSIAREAGGLEVLFTLIFFVMIFGMRSGLFGFFLLGSMAGGRRRGGAWHGTGYGSSGGAFGGFGGFGGGMTGGGGGGGGW